MSLPSSGSMTPAQQAHEVLGGGGGGGHARILPARPCNLGSWTSGVETPATALGSILKALGDNTRYAIYLELARSAVAAGHRRHRRDASDLHPNTVRPHLERMREVGLLGGRERPPGRARAGPSTATRWRPTAPSLGLEPPSFPLMARMLLRLAEATGAGAEEARDAGRDQGQADAPRPRRAGTLPATRSRPAGHARASTRPVADDDASPRGVHALPVPRAGRGQPRPGVQPAPGPGRGFRRRRGRRRVDGFGTLVDRDPVPGRPRAVRRRTT